MLGGRKKLKQVLFIAMISIVLIWTFHVSVDMPAKYPNCSIISHRIDTDDCTYLNKVASLIESNKVSKLKSYVLHLMESHKKVSEVLVIGINYTAIDFYSIDDLKRGGVGPQWTNVHNADYSQKDLAYIERTFVISGQHLHARHEHLRKVYQHHYLDSKKLEWRWKWNNTLCLSENGQHETKTMMNLLGDRVQFSNKVQEQQCAVTMEHVELWYDIAARNYSWSLILEDDSIFVPYFKEKFNYFIQKVLHNNEFLIKQKESSMLVIGGCIEFHDARFRSSQADSDPIISVQKRNATRCSHAYLLTSDSARIIVNEIKKEKNLFVASDIFLQKIFERSTKLVSIWLDPPIVYQGNQILNFDNSSQFMNKSYTYV